MSPLDKSEQARKWESCAYRPNILLAAELWLFIFRVQFNGGTTLEYLRRCLWRSYV